MKINITLFKFYLFNCIYYKNNFTFLILFIQLELNL